MLRYRSKTRVYKEQKTFRVVDDQRDNHQLRFKEKTADDDLHAFVQSLSS